MCNKQRQARSKLDLIQALQLFATTRFPLVPFDFRWVVKSAMRVPEVRAIHPRLAPIVASFLFVAPAAHPALLTLIV